MKPSDAVEGKSSEIKQLIESYWFVSPAIFGSTAKGMDKVGHRLRSLPIRSAFIVFSSVQLGYIDRR